ncbi:MAG: hypothetical protein QOE22_658 [Candidatus Parcubacteria bacterium]|jgi:hypothetical protein|nr:hypothetical protein [Candidatus Parcubacteria bacterium]
MPVNLEKATESLGISLKKKGVLTLPTVDVVFDFDVSGSYKDEHEDGLTEALMTRVFPWGLLLDPDKKMEVFTFSDGARHAHYVGDVTEATYLGYVKRNIINKVPGWCGYTDYAHVLRLNLQQLGYVGGGKTSDAPLTMPAHIGWYKPGEKPATLDYLASRKSLIIFNTDGANDDESETEALFEEMERKGYSVYVMFIGVSNQNEKFTFLKKLAKRFANCGLTIIRDMDAWVKKTDEEIADELITEELIAWFNN